MKKIAIVTLYANTNYGNKLQNYAVQEILKEQGEYEVITLKSKYNTSITKKIKFLGKYLLQPFVKKYKLEIAKNKEKLKNTTEQDKIRLKNFEAFDEKILKSNDYEYIEKTSKNLEDKYDAFVVGSDQVWNPNIIGGSDLFLLNSIKNREKKISFSASFGVKSIRSKHISKYKKCLQNFKAISVREESGKDIIEDLVKRKDVEVLLDPTMLLNTDKWNNVMKKPEQIAENQKFILNYFLGTSTYNSNKEEIERIAKENNCKIINILDKNDSFYTCGPSEFLWLEKNAFLVCTDSFHSSVFAILFNTPFVVFNREDGQNGKNNMNSRLETLLKKFELENRYFKDEITKDMLIVNYPLKEKVLKEEREKANSFLKKALKNI